MRRLIGFATQALVLSACGEGQAPSDGTSTRLSGGMVARVGSAEIAAGEVAAVATARHLDSVAARRATVRDALFAEAAVADAEVPVFDVEARVLARAMLDALSRDARSEPIDEDEFNNWTLARFIDVDRPEGFRVVHAVILIDADVSEPTQRAAREHAEGLRSKLLTPAASAAAKPAPVRLGRDVFLSRPGLVEDPIAETFRETVNEWKHDKFETRYESLGVISADGRYLDYARSPWDRLLPDFARAAARLQRRGDVSPVVETEIELENAKRMRGYHVIVLLERTPAFKLSPDEARAVLRPEIHQSRARLAKLRLLETLRGQTNIVLERNVDAQLAAMPGLNH